MGAAVGEPVSLLGSTGLPFIVLVVHVAMGIIGLGTGAVAIVARKGGTWHRRAGVIFVYSMIAMALSAVMIAAYEGAATVMSGAFTAYLVFTAFTTLQPPPRTRLPAIVLMVIAFIMSAGQFTLGIDALGRPGSHRDGVPAGMILFLASIFLLAAIGDARMIHAGGIHGARRLARHLWRMCFALFIATGSFVAQLVRMPFIPEPMRSLPVILLLSVGPLAVLLFWMWKVRLRGEPPRRP